MDHLNGLDLAGKAVQDSPAPPKLKLRTQAGLSKKRIESRRTRREVVPPSPCPLIDTDWREQLPPTPTYSTKGGMDTAVRSGLLHIRSANSLNALKTGSRELSIGFMGSETRGRHSSHSVVPARTRLFDR